MSDDYEFNITHALDSMFRGNRAQFKDSVEAALADKVANAVELRREDLARTVFDPAAADREEPEDDEVIELEGVDEETIAGAIEALAEERVSDKYLGTVKNDAEGNAHLDLIRGIASHVNRHIVPEGSRKIKIDVAPRLGKDNPNAGDYRSGRKPYQRILKKDASHYDVYVTHR